MVLFLILSKHFEKGSVRIVVPNTRCHCPPIKVHQKVSQDLPDYLSQVSEQLVPRSLCVGVMRFMKGGQWVEGRQRTLA